MNRSTGPSTAAEVAVAAGADDLFVLRRIAAGRFAHVGGVGRGGGWAGIVEVDEHELAPTADRVAVRQSDEPEHVFGPYWARWTVTVRLSPDLVVVFGGEPRTDELSRDEYVLLAEYAAEQLVEVAAAKRLADELEVLTAVQELLRQPPEATPELLGHLAGHATRALSCELGVAYLAEQKLVAVCDLRERTPLAESEVLAAADQLLAASPLPRCSQDAVCQDLPAPFSAADGIRSYYFLELKEPARGFLLLMHTDTAPARGFTSLCQALGLQIAEAAQPLLTASLLRDRMDERLRSAEAAARRDPLTGLANRLAWDEACARVSDQPPTGVVIIDAARLKAVNESYGHHFGDELLCRIADALRASVRADDVVARIGGDEFAILLPSSDEAEVKSVIGRIRARVADARLPNGDPMEVACGWTVERSSNLAAAQKRADTSMLDEKRARRAA